MMELRREYDNSFIRAAIELASKMGKEKEVKDILLLSNDGGSGLDDRSEQLNASTRAPQSDIFRGMKLAQAILPDLDNLVAVSGDQQKVGRDVKDFMTGLKVQLAQTTPLMNQLGRFIDKHDATQNKPISANFKAIVQGMQQLKAGVDGIDFNEIGNEIKKIPQVSEIIKSIDGIKTAYDKFKNSKQSDIFSTATSIFQFVNSFSENGLNIIGQVKDVHARVKDLVNNRTQILNTNNQNPPANDQAIKSLKSQLESNSDGLKDAINEIPKNLNNAGNNLETLSTIGVAVGLFGQMIAENFDAKLGRDIQRVGEAAVTVATAFNAIAAGAAAGSVAGPVGIAVGAAFSLMKIYGERQSEDNGMQVISRQIQQLTNLVVRLGEHIDNRFDRVEGILVAAVEHIDKRFENLEKILGAGFSDLKEILGEHNEQMHARFNALGDIIVLGNQQMHERSDRIEKMLTLNYNYMSQNFGVMNQRFDAVENMMTAYHSETLHRFNTVGRVLSYIHHYNQEGFNRMAKIMDVLHTTIQDRFNRAEEHLAAIEMATRYNFDKVLSTLYENHAEVKSMLIQISRGQIIQFELLERTAQFARFAREENLALASNAALGPYRTTLGRVLANAIAPNKLEVTLVDLIANGMGVKSNPAFFGLSDPGMSVSQIFLRGSVESNLKYMISYYNTHCRNGSGSQQVEDMTHPGIWARYCSLIIQLVYRNRMTISPTFEQQLMQFVAEGESFQANLKKMQRSPKLFNYLFSGYRQAVESVAMQIESALFSSTNPGSSQLKSKLQTFFDRKLPFTVSEETLIGSVDHRATPVISSHTVDITDYKKPFKYLLVQGGGLLFLPEKGAYLINSDDVKVQEQHFIYDAQQVECVFRSPMGKIVVADKSTLLVFDRGNQMSAPRAPARYVDHGSKSIKAIAMEGDSLFSASTLVVCRNLKNTNERAISFGDGSEIKNLLILRGGLLVVAREGNISFWKKTPQGYEKVHEENHPQFNPMTIAGTANGLLLCGLRSAQVMIIDPSQKQNTLLQKSLGEAPSYLVIDHLGYLVTANNQSGLKIWKVSSGDIELMHHNPRLLSIVGLNVDSNNRYEIFQTEGVDFLRVNRYAFPTKTLANYYKNHQEILTDKVNTSIQTHQSNILSDFFAALKESRSNSATIENLYTVLRSSVQPNTNLAFKDALEKLENYRILIVAYSQLCFSNASIKIADLELFLPKLLSRDAIMNYLTNPGDKSFIYHYLFGEHLPEAESVLKVVLSTVSELNAKPETGAGYPLVDRMSTEMKEMLLIMRERKPPAQKERDLYAALQDLRNYIDVNKSAFVLFQTKAEWNSRAVKIQCYLRNPIDCSGLIEAAKNKLNSVLGQLLESRFTVSADSTGSVTFNIQLAQNATPQDFHKVLNLCKSFASIKGIIGANKNGLFYQNGHFVSESEFETTEEEQTNCIIA